ncbi:high mobility group B protein 6-like protein [Tanacetum coccineum]|uniref:High mobility group B protein 6-like protein n=1 Tax=Tanacetum coccineum TaxID=301880 RepID=A0ABQ5EFW1_9ASTR
METTKVSLFLHRMIPLSEDNSWEMFKENIGIKKSKHAILQRCEDLPLNFILLAGLLKRKDPSSWQFAQRSRVWKIQYIAELERNVQALQAKHLSSTRERFKVVFVDGILLTKAKIMIGCTSDGMEARKEKDSLKLKRPESAYFLLMNERRDALVAESKSQVEIAKLTREEWKNMTKNQKASYEIVAKQNKKYTQEIKVYKQNKREDELLQVLKHKALQLLKERKLKPSLRVDISVDVTLKYMCYV